MSTDDPVRSAIDHLRQAVEALAQSAEAPSAADNHELYEHAEQEGDAVLAKAISDFSAEERVRRERQTQHISNWMLVVGVPVFVLVFGIAGMTGNPQMLAALWAAAMIGLMIYVIRSALRLELVAWAVVVMTLVVVFSAALDLRFRWPLGIGAAVIGSLCLLLVANRKLKRSDGRLYYRTFMMAGSISAVCAVALTWGLLFGLFAMFSAVLLWVLWAAGKPNDLIRKYKPVLDRPPQRVELPWSVRKFSDQAQMMMDARAYTRQHWVPALLPWLALGSVAAFGALWVASQLFRNGEVSVWLVVLLVALAASALAAPVVRWATYYVVVTGEAVFSCAARPPEGDSPATLFTFVKSVDPFRSIPGRMFGWINLGIHLIDEAPLPTDRKSRRARIKALREQNKPFRWVPEDSRVVPELSRPFMTPRRPLER